MCLIRDHSGQVAGDLQKRGFHLPVFRNLRPWALMDGTRAGLVFSWAMFGTVPALSAIVPYLLVLGPLRKL